ncbi:unnamed protein product [Adineta steineri]|uniref:F-box domain-containing protein n=1 Tax=Adineta steineri TaxID=433720 RepID=A0A815PJI3_9BILA|nr:unnamed protein product [Adineta steineri]
MSITCIENLSNEFFYEMFDYLDGYDIYKAFSNMNHRFQQLVNSSFILFKIKFDSIFDELYTDDFKQFLLFNQQQIYSIQLSISKENEHIFSYLPIHSQFNRLESLVLNELEPIILISLLPKLTCLSRLYSLTVDIWNSSDKLGHVYQLVLTLPKLKYFKCSAEDSDINVPIPFAMKNQYSTIEHLVINHSCTFNELSAILSYTPQICRLNFAHLNDSNSPIATILPIKLANLTYITFDIPYIIFDEFKMFITSLDCQLKILRFYTRSSDINYLEANQWEELILKYLPQLEKFYFQYVEEIEHDYHCATYLEDFNQFNSSFWIERKWEFVTEMDPCEVLHSIHPYKKRWHDNISSNKFFESLRLNLICPSREEYLELPETNIYNIFTTTHFHYLEIQKEKIDFSILINIIDSLSELDSLKIHSLSLSSTKSLSMEKIIRQFISNKNKITKICLENMIEIEEVYFLIKLCPHLNYLQINSLNTIDIELFVQNIINKIKNDYNHNLRVLCFCISTADDDLVQEFEEMAISQNFFLDYTIKYELNHIYITMKI